MNFRISKMSPNAVYQKRAKSRSEKKKKSENEVGARVQKVERGFAHAQKKNSCWNRSTMNGILSRLPHALSVLAYFRVPGEMAQFERLASGEPSR